jgi:hypothetical protein
MVQISRATAEEPAVQSFLQSNNSDRVARRGELIEVLHHMVILAKEDADIVGVLTYNISGGSCEVLTLHCARRWSGTGTLLLEAMLETRDGAWSRLQARVGGHDERQCGCVALLPAPRVPADCTAAGSSRQGAS